MEGSSDQLLVTLVHGTFARGASWTQDGSSIRRVLRERFGDRAIFQRFDWSARNTHSARLSAGRELAQFLETRAKDNPGARNVLITHSHGGNVAIYACKHAPPGLINDIVFLATPFIRCRNRLRIPALAYAGMFMLSAFFGFLLTMLLFPIEPVVTAAAPYFPSLSIAHTTIALGVILLAGALVFWGFRAYLMRSALKRLESLSWPAAANVNTLCVYYNTDEAKGFLSALNWSTTGLARFAWSLIGFTIVAFLVYVGATLYFKAYHPQIYDSIVFSTPRMWWGEGPVIQRGAWYELIGGYILAGLPLALLAAYALPMLRGHPLGYGWELPSSTVILDVDVISEPDGFVTGSSESVAVDLGDAKRQGLVHSFVYEDARVLDRIAGWLARKVAAQTV